MTMDYIQFEKRKRHNSIPVTKESGLNPTMGICYFCGEPDGSIALLGANFKGEAPKYMVLGIEPCPKCAEEHKGKIFIVGVTSTYDKDFRGLNLGKDKNTGKYIVASGKSLIVNKEFFQEEFIKGLGDIGDGKIVFMDDTELCNLIESIESQGNNKESEN